ncbi:MAG: hypothetical protein ACREIV_01795 [Planctomycetaceae bacterium]
MATTETLRGLLKSDGSLELQDSPTLPPGPVRVILESASSPQHKDPWAALEWIWDERKRLGLQPRSAEEIDAELHAMRKEWQQREVEIERIQDESRQHRGG